MDRSVSKSITVLIPNPTKELLGERFGAQKPQTYTLNMRQSHFRPWFSRECSYKNFGKETNLKAEPKLPTIRLIQQGKPPQSLTFSKI
jgi:hypothetical protein